MPRRGALGTAAEPHKPPVAGAEAAVLLQVLLALLPAASPVVVPLSMEPLGGPIEAVMGGLSLSAGTIVATGSYVSVILQQNKQQGLLPRRTFRAAAAETFKAAANQLAPTSRPRTLVADRTEVVCNAA